jgi:hypothetical protein
MKMLAIILVPLVVAGCGMLDREPAVAPAPPAPAASANPSALIAASSARVRTVIASRAVARGTKVASNTPAGVVLERDLSESTAAVVELCGDHKPGRIVRIVLSTQEAAGQTRVEERRFVVDGGQSCQLRLSPAEVEQANQGLDEIGKQATGRSA